MSTNKVCVVGAGTMGSGIAAHLANLGFEVTLLDATAESVQEAFARAKGARPPHFFLPETANTIRLGSVRDNLDWIAEAGWVCEAIIEKLDAKRALFEQIEAVLPPDSMISTNTSGLEIELLAEGRSESFRQRFLGTHFFNPPRYLKLLELIPTRETDSDAIAAMTAFLEERVARRVVPAKDTPGFIANRFGMWAMIHAIHVAEKLHLSIEQVDAITGPFLGRPRSASFRLNDLVGLDIMQDIASNLQARCPHDPHMGSLDTPRSMATLLERGWIGDKAGQGYYRREGREFVALDLDTLAYRERKDVKFESLDALAKLPLGERVAAALQLKDEAGEFLRGHLVPVVAYADYLKEEISHSVQDFDRVMMWGFGWEAGPFAMADGIGHAALGLPEAPYYQNGTQRAFDGTYVSLPAEPQYRVLGDYPLVSQHEGFNVRDLGDGVSAIALTSKMGVLSPPLIRALLDHLRGGSIKRLVLGSEARSFSAGFDLKFVLASLEQPDAIRAALDDLQQLGATLQSIPSVAAIFGHCLGAGWEVAFSCSTVAASPEMQIGLPESRVGLFPAGRGTTLMRLRHQQSAKTLADAAMLLILGTTATNADQARKLGIMRATDVTVYHPDRLITEAKRLALEADVRPNPEWKMPEGPFSGMLDRLEDEARQRGDTTDHDSLIGAHIKQIFRAPTIEEALRLEREEFLDLCAKALTQQRIKHILETGKPLKN
ncbi:MAG: 3-hydroxyacyl-CoA dehydrogenase/enoyl-CoA hydratase family protein [Fimbriimonadaceae bacterium]|nr:3-hydroxyacyl-CoA dehydrogenase/enoyl-CoA hydratase family protein [Fimbriimonadaceae bacterium]